MTTHHQAALPPGWRLEDEVELPSGRRVTGTTARVYCLLELTRRHQHRWHVGRHHAPPGWVPTWVLREPWSGGAAGDRRLRDLRKAGVAIDDRAFDAGDGEPASRSWLWRLGNGSGAASRDAGLPLAGLVAEFECSFPRRPGAIEISPGASSPLAPSFEAAAAGAEAYRQELLARYRAGTLLPALTGRSQAVLWTDPAASFDPRPVLSAALTKLGATVQGGLFAG